MFTDAYNYVIQLQNMAKVFAVCLICAQVIIICFCAVISSKQAQIENKINLLLKQRGIKDNEQNY